MDVIDILSLFIKDMGKRPFRSYRDISQEDIVLEIYLLQVVQWCFRTETLWILRKNTVIYLGKVPFRRKEHCCRLRTSYNGIVFVQTKRHTRKSFRANNVDIMQWLSKSFGTNIIKSVCYELIWSVRKDNDRLPDSVVVNAKRANEVVSEGRLPAFCTVTGDGTAYFK